MAVEKLSVSMSASLVKLVRDAASDDGVSVSTWLSEAAEVRARQRALRVALAERDRRDVAISVDEAALLVDEARARSVVVRPKRRRR